MGRIAPTKAVSIELNALDLFTLHCGLMDLYPMFTHHDEKATIDPRLFDLARRLETAMLSTGDIERPIIQNMITGRANTESENLSRIQQFGSVDMWIPGVFPENE